jgi:hypothetical protein
MIQRREALKVIAVMLGGAISVPTLMAMDQMHAGGAKMLSEGTFVLTQNQKNLVAEVAEMILPKTSTPGAKDAGVPAFIEIMIRDCYRKPEFISFVEGINDLEKNKFRSGSEAEKAAMLTDMEQKSKGLFQIYQAQQTRLLSGQDPKLAEGDVIGVPFWRLMKELTLLGYYTSEVGIKASFDYVPIPGRLELVKLKPGQKAFVY